MRIDGVAMVRNESDLAEAFVRHNLGVLDTLYVVDHVSDDGTRQILRALAEEGLPLVVSHDDQPAQRQPEIITHLARCAFKAGAHAVVPLDADEFLKVPDRSLLESAIAGLPADLCGAMEWQTYVPEPLTGAAHPLAAARRRRVKEAHGLYKVLLTRVFAATAGATVGPGNHTVLMEGPRQDVNANPVRLARVLPGVATLAHFPVRNGAQLVRKVSVGWRAHQAANREGASFAYHWRELDEALARHGVPDPAQLVAIAANYALAMSRWEPLAAIPLVEDPLPATTELRYGHLARAVPLAVGR
jgi:glycosyl transferase family 2